MGHMASSQSVSFRGLRAARTEQTASHEALSLGYNLMLKASLEAA